MIFGNPVPGVIHPKGWTRPAGNTEFRQVRTCADHRATNQGCANDFGNARCDAKVFAAADGIILARADWMIVEGTVRIRHADGWLTGYTHMKPVLVQPGQSVVRGQQIGVVGDAHSPSVTNFSGCHLHFQTQLNGVDQDPWPLLAQNQPEPPAPEEPMSKIITVLSNAKAAVPAQSVVYDAPALTASQASTGTSARVLPAIYIVEGAPGEWVECANNGRRRYFPKGKVTVTSQPADPCLNEKAELAAANARIAAAKTALG